VTVPPPPPQHLSANVSAIHPQSHMNPSVITAPPPPPHVNPGMAPMAHMNVIPPQNPILPHYANQRKKSK